MSNSKFVVEATMDNFNSVVIEKSKEVPVLVDFWAAWCGPCKMLLPVVTKLADEYAGKFQLAKVNTDEQRDLAINHGIRSLPTLRLYVDGDMKEEVIGLQPEGALRKLIDSYSK